MKTIKSDRVLMVDCDDTLVLWDISKYNLTQLDYVTVNVWQPTTLIKHQKNINLLTKFHKLGYTIIVWSQSGWEWAEAVGKAVGIDELVTSYMSKPRYYLDDLDCQTWMGSRIWRDPVEKEEHGNA